ncbi:MAG: hypothetical protein EOR84_05140 [Mesorhizobium sp.]|uniref:DUF6647 family protein n=1 Tax=Mesorhizobium sp. TaxID=1871066 RepID=UPI000FE5F28F|nr:DUF6647 family protein [Mesorhizobium sp.]RWN02221.1 MAG: hypothetical protein EOR84_05140 [Mesorhizobium sp.]
MDELVNIIVLWLTVTFGLPESPQHPRIQHLSPTQMAAIRYGPGRTDHSEQVVALYHDDTRTIVLRPDWNAGSAADVSALVHELVHHLQNFESKTYACPEEREALAYDAQRRWLAFFGEDLESAFGIDPMTLLVRTTCAY